MENYDAIIKCINDTLKDKESSLNYYREEMPKREATIRELKEKLEKAEAKLTELSKNYDELQDSFDKKLDENSSLKEANAKLTAKINEIEKF